jgi:hypothetical protein
VHLASTNLQVHTLCLSAVRVAVRHALNLDGELTHIAGGLRQPCIPPLADPVAGNGEGYHVADGPDRVVELIAFEQVPEEFTQRCPEPGRDDRCTPWDEGGERERDEERFKVDIDRDLRHGF